MFAISLTKSAFGWYYIVTELNSVQIREQKGTQNRAGDTKEQEVQTMDREKLAELFEDMDNTAQSGYELCKALGAEFNCAGDFSRMASELYESLGKKGKKLLDQCMCIVAMCMAYDYLAFSHGEYTDRRNEASRRYSFEHQNEFREKMEDLIGFHPEYRDSKYFVKTLGLREWKERGLLYLIGFANRWDETHPTIQQSVFGGYVNGVMQAHAAFPYV
jgi:hypothetical protein